MNLQQRFSRFGNRLNQSVDGRLLAAGLGLALLASCTAETQGSSSSPLLGVYSQIDRVGRPGVKEIFENFSDHETSNRNSPATDPALNAAIVSFMTATGASPARNASSADAATISKTFFPDEIQANLGGTATTASYLSLEAGTANDFGGRALTDAAMQTDLAAIYGSTFGTAASSNVCLMTDGLTTSGLSPLGTFPYVQ